MRQSHSIISNATFMWGAQVLSLLPPLILVPYLLGTIGEIGYGIYALVWSLLASIEQLQRSLQSGVVKYSAGFLAVEERGNVNRVVSSSFVYSVILAIVFCAGIIVTGVFSNDPSGQMGPVLVVVGIMCLFIFPLTPYIAVIQSRQKYFVGAIAETGSKYISLLVVMMWFHMVGPSVTSLIVIMVLMMFVARLVQVPVAYRLVPGLKIQPHLFTSKFFKMICAFGASTVLASLCLVINSTGVRWLMGSLVSTSFVAHLAIMLMPVMLLSQIISAMTITAMPATSAYVATGNQSKLQELLIRGMRYTTLLILSGLIVAGFFMQNVVSVWVGSEYEFLAPYTMVLLICNAFMLSTSIGHHMLKGLGKLRAVIYIYAFGLVIVPIGLILALFHFFKDPYVAVTFGLSAGYLVCGFLHIVYCTKLLHVTLRKLLILVYVKPLIVAMLVYLILLGVVAVAGINGLVGRAGISLFAFLLFFGSCWIFITTEDERIQAEEVMKWIRDKLRLLCKLSQGKQKW